MDIYAKLEELGLAKHLPEATWPTASAVREIASKVMSLEIKGVKNAFIAADLKKSVETAHCVVMFSSLVLRQVLTAILPRFLPCDGGRWWEWWRAKV